MPRQLFGRQCSVDAARCHGPDRCPHVTTATWATSPGGRGASSASRCWLGLAGRAGVRQEEPLLVAGHQLAGASWFSRAGRCSPGAAAIRVGTWGTAAEFAADRSTPSDVRGPCPLRTFHRPRPLPVGVDTAADRSTQLTASADRSTPTEPLGPVIYFYIHSIFQQFQHP
jgi:hypothetical protein